MDAAHERDTTRATLQAAVTRLGGELNTRLIPPEGMSYGFAIRGAHDNGGVVAVSGGIKSGTAGPAITGPCEFGTDEPVVRVILTVMKFDPFMRSAAILQFSERAGAVFEKDLFLECAYLDETSTDTGISTMDWGIASCCRDGVPDVIFRRGNSAAGSRIILSGERPDDVANNIIICSNRI